MYLYKYVPEYIPKELCIYLMEREEERRGGEGEGREPRKRGGKVGGGRGARIGSD